MEKLNPALQWRNIIGNNLNNKYKEKAKISPEEFYYDVKSKCETEKISLAESKDNIKFHKLSLFVLSCLRLTFGDLDAVEDILANVPERKYSVSTLVGCVFSLLPVDEAIKDNYEQIMNWVATNRNNMSWDDDKGMFYKKAEML